MSLPEILANNQLTAWELEVVQEIAGIGQPVTNILLGWDTTDQSWVAFNLGSGLSYDHSTHTLSAAGGGSGTVTDVSVVSANGFAGSVATSTTTPAITLTTTINSPVLAGNGTAIAAATTTGSGSTVVLATSPTFQTSINGAYLTASEILITDGSKNIVSASVSTYPSLTELTYLKGVTSSIQTQLNAKGSGTVTSVGFTGGLISVANATTTPALTVAGTSGGIPYFSSTSTWASSAALAANAIVIGGGAGAAPSTTTTGTGVLTALGINVGSAGAFVTFNGALGTPSSGTVTNLTGTASININGTVGATTPTTGVFTTLVAGSTTSLLLGTAGSAVGNIGFRNATSGTITLAPVTGALGTVTLTLPAITDTLVTLTASQTLTNKTLTSPAIGGTALLAEGAGIGLDPSLSADGTWAGITMTATAGYTQAFGDLVYLSVTDSRWELADADAASTAGPVALAMVVVAGTDGNSCTLLLQGVIRADAKFPTMTVGATQYVGETAGAIQGTIPTGADNVIRTVGYALTADALYFNPSTDWQTTVA